MKWCDQNQALKKNQDFSMVSFTEKLSEKGNQESSYEAIAMI